jgi:hypothetical protein
LPPSDIFRSHDAGLFFDDALGFKLRSQGDPDALGRGNFRRHALGGGNDGVEIRDEILAGHATGHVSARFIGKRRNLILLEDAL